MMFPLPESTEVEKCVISTLVQDGESLQYLESVTDDLFTSSKHVLILECIKALTSAGAPVDIVTVCNQLREWGKLDQAGGTPYLSEVCQSAVVAGIGYYLGILRKVTLRREIVRKGYTLAQDASNEDADIQTLLKSVQVLTETIESGENPEAFSGSVVTIQDLSQAIDNHFRVGLQTAGVNPGWVKLCNHYRPAKRALTVITGIPSHGKSEFMDALMVNTAKAHAWTWAVYSPENYPYEYHVQKLVEKVIGKGFWNGLSKTELDTTLEWLGEHFVFIEPGERARTISGIIGLIEKAMTSRHIDGVVLDPYNEIEPAPLNNENETAYIGRVLSRCRRFARSKDVAFFIIAHPTKMQREPKDAKRYMVPTLYDINGSANWYNKSDCGICVYRDFQREVVQVHVQKIRFKAQGRPGKVEFKYDRLNGRFSEIDETEGWN